MLVQGLVRVIENRQEDGRGPLPLNELEDEFLAFWKVPFKEGDVESFLRKWPNKVKVMGSGGAMCVQLANQDVVETFEQTARKESTQRAVSK